MLADNGAQATGTRTPHGGILAAPGYTDFNPERFVADDEILRDQIMPRPVAAMPLMNVGDHVTSMLVGPLDYSFNNYKIQQLATPTFVSSGLGPRRRRLPSIRSSWSARSTSRTSIQATVCCSAGSPGKS